EGDSSSQERNEGSLVNTALRILSYLKPYWRRLIVVYVALLIAVAGQTAIPLVLGNAVDHGVVEHNTTYLWQAALGLVGLAAMQGVFTFVRSFNLNVLAEYVTRDLRDALYGKFEELPFQFYDQAETGQLMSRATDDVRQIRAMLL